MQAEDLPKSFWHQTQQTLTPVPLNGVASWTAQARKFRKGPHWWVLSGETEPVEDTAHTCALTHMCTHTQDRSQLTVF